MTCPKFGVQHTFEYNSNNQLTKSVRHQDKAKDFTWQYEYDSQGRWVRTTQDIEYYYQGETNGSPIFLSDTIVRTVSYNPDGTRSRMDVKGSYGTGYTLFEYANGNQIGVESLPYGAPATSIPTRYQYEYYLDKENKN